MSFHFVALCLFLVGACAAPLVRDAGVEAGQEVVDLPGDHQTVILRAWGFEIDESSFSGRRVDELLPVEKRFLGRVDLVTGGR